MPITRRKIVTALSALVRPHHSLRLRHLDEHEANVPLTVPCPPHPPLSLLMPQNPHPLPSPPNNPDSIHPRPPSNDWPNNLHFNNRPLLPPSPKFQIPHDNRPTPTTLGGSSPPSPHNPHNRPRNPHGHVFANVRRANV